MSEAVHEPGYPVTDTGGGYQAIPVEVVNQPKPCGCGKRKRRSIVTRTWTLQAGDSGVGGGTKAQQLLPPSTNRVDAWITSITSPTAGTPAPIPAIFLGKSESDAQQQSGAVAVLYGSNLTPQVASPAVVTPAVPATGVAAQNPNPYGVQVVISANGATITNVSVNGVTVGTAAGTYFVPQFGAISIAYSVAVPTWVWTNPAPVAAGGQVQTGSPDVPFQINTTDQVWASAAIAALPVSVSVIAFYEQEEN